MSAQPQRQADGFRTGQAPAANDASVGTLLRELVHEVPSLLSKEVELAKSEMREGLDDTKKALTATALGAAVALGGFAILLLSAVYALSNIVEPWLAALIVGGIALIVGYGMVQAGRKKVDAQSLKPSRTIQSLREDKEALKGRTA